MVSRIQPCARDTTLPRPPVSPLDRRLRRGTYINSNAPESAVSITISNLPRDPNKRIILTKNPRRVSQIAFVAQTLLSVLTSSFAHTDPKLSGLLFYKQKRNYSERSLASKYRRMCRLRTPEIGRPISPLTRATCALFGKQPGGYAPTVPKRELAGRRRRGLVSPTYRAGRVG